jgi:hypothetical protein
VEQLPGFDSETHEDPIFNSGDHQDPTENFPYLDTSYTSGDIASFVARLSHEEVVGQQEYNPEYDGYEFNQDIFTQPDYQILLSRITFGPSYSTKVNLATLKPWHRVVYPNVDPQKLQPFLAYRPLDIVKKTLEHTTQLAKSSIKYPLQRHFKARNPFSNVHRLDETVSTDPIFANCKSIYDNFTGAQVYYGLSSHNIQVYGIKSKGEFPQTYRDFIREEGAPSTLRRDNAKEEDSEEVKGIQRNLLVQDQFSEPHHQHQNPVEGGAIKWLKAASHRLLDRTGAPDSAWYLALKYLADIHNISYDRTIGMTPYQKRHGRTPDISAYLQHTFWSPILYYDHEETWPATKERTGRWVGVAKNVGDCLTYWIVDEQTHQLYARSVV